MSKGHPLKVLAAVHDLTYKQIADMFDRSEPLIKKWISGQGTPTLQDLFNFQKNSTFTKQEIDKLARDWIDWLNYERDIG